MAKSKTMKGICRTATNLQYTSTIQACWHSSITCTSKSTANELKSDLNAAMYEFCLDRTTENILKVLKALKHSPLKIDKIFQDESVFCEDLNASLKMCFYFYLNKSELTVTISLKPPSKPGRKIVSNDTYTNSNYSKLSKALSFIEEEYKSL